MPIASALQTALTGMSAAQFTVGVVANNVANSQTNGFKASSPVFATQSPASFRQGAAPNSAMGGRNPVQVGRGVQVAGIATDMSPGSIVSTSDSMSLALEGDGFFIVEGPGGERLFSRNGDFQLNSSGEIVTATGDRVLGFAVDGDLQIQDNELVPLSIPLGMSVQSDTGSVARLTRVRVTGDGRIRGAFTDGVSRDLGQFQLARFANPSGLTQREHNLFAPSPNSGLPIETSPGSLGAPTMMAGATELSNTDIGQSMIDLMMASLQFRASALVIGTADQILEDLVNLRR